MPQLIDVDVQFVSIVDKAAVRDPHNKSAPRRFLLWKSASHIESPAPAQSAADRGDAEEVAVPGPTASREEQLEYLRSVSPSAAAVFDRQHPTIQKEASPVSTTAVPTSEARRMSREEQAAYLEAMSPEAAQAAEQHGATDDDDGAALADARAKIARQLEDADDLPESTVEKLEKAATALEVEMVGQLNPHSARAWDELRGRDGVGGA